MTRSQSRTCFAPLRMIHPWVLVVLVVLGLQEECIKTMECSVVNYNVQTETTALGSDEKVAHLV